jgi:hypothetical protein
MKSWLKIHIFVLNVVKQSYKRVKNFIQMSFLSLMVHHLLFNHFLALAAAFFALLIAAFFAAAAAFIAASARS